MAVAVLAALALPLVFRGPRFVWLVDRVKPAIRGNLQVTGGAVALDAAWALAMGRPVGVVVEGLLVLDSEGTQVLRMERVTAAVELQRRPLRVTVHDLHLVHGAWRLGTMRAERGLGFFAAFAAPPAVPGRPGVRRAPGPARAGVPGGAFRIAEAWLDGIDAVFDFPVWGLALRDVQARGVLRVGGGAPLFEFAVSDIDAQKGGELRLGSAAPVILPFSRAHLSRVGTGPVSPDDLSLAVVGALTGSSRLSGALTFTRLFRFSGRGGGSPGMDLHATWAQAADGVGALLGSRGLASISVAGADAAISASLSGPFDNLAGGARVRGFDVAYAGRRFLGLGFDLRATARPLDVSLRGLRFGAPDGGHARADVDLGADRVLRAALHFEDLEDGAYLPPHLRPSLAGVLNGDLRAHAGLDGRTATVDAIDLHLHRRGRGPLPQDLRVRGDGLPPAPGPTAFDGTLVLSGVRFADRTLSVRSVAASAFGGSVSARGALTLADPLRPGAPRVVADGQARGIDLSRFVRGLGVAGRLSLQAHAAGTLDDLTVDLALPGGQRVSLLKGVYDVSDAVSARLRGGRLTFSSAGLRRQGGGTAEAHGTLGPGQRVDLTLDVRDHPLSALPGFARLEMPVTGFFGASLHAAGTGRGARVDGKLLLDRVTVGGTSFGQGTLVVSPAGPGAVTVAGDLFGNVGVDARYALGVAGQSLAVAFDLRQFPLAPFVPGLSRLPDLRSTATGRVRVDVRGGRGPIVDGQLTVALGAGQAAGGDVSVKGRLVEGQIDGTIVGRLDARLVEPLTRPWRIAAIGILGVDLAVAGPVMAPSVRGTLAVAEPWRVAVAGFEVGIPSGSFLIDGARVRTSGLPVVVEGATLRLDGDATLDAASPLASPFALSAHGQLDARVLERLVPQFVTGADGQARVHTTITGTVDNPRFAGAVEFGAVHVQLRVPTLGQGPVTAWIRGGRLTGDGRSVTVDNLVIDVGPRGRVVVGPPGSPAHLTVAGLFRFAGAALRLPVHVTDVAIGAGPVALERWDAQVILGGAPERGPLVLSGDIRLDEGRYSAVSRPSAASRPAERAASARGAAARAPTLLGGTRLDLRLRSDGHRFVVDPGWLPDLHIAADLRVAGTVTSPRVSGSTDGKGLYSWLAVSLYKLFH